MTSLSILCYKSFVQQKFKNVFVCVGGGGIHICVWVGEGGIHVDTLKKNNFLPFHQILKAAVYTR